MLATSQDPAAVVVYDITDPTNPTWDSGAIAQFVDYSAGDGESTGESEGLAYKDGYVLGLNTTDPSVCLLKASWLNKLIRLCFFARELCSHFYFFLIKTKT